MNDSIKITYPHLNNLPVATIILERGPKVDNQAMPDIVIDKFYSDEDGKPINKRNIKITIEAGATRLDTIKLYVEPNYMLNGSFHHYIKGITIDEWHGNKETDNRVERIIEDCTDALTKVYKLANQKDLDALKPLIEEAIIELDKIKRK